MIDRCSAGFCGLGFYAHSLVQLQLGPRGIKIPCLEYEETIVRFMGVC